MTNTLDNKIIKKGYGYWETDYYPIGGCFRRATEDIEVKVIRIFKNFHGATFEGYTKDNKKVAA